MNPFEKALELFGDDGRGWTKGNTVERRPDGGLAYCAGGALSAACRVRYGHTFDDAAFDRFCATTTVLSRHLYREGAAIYEAAAISDWNDRDTTTFEDVRLAFKHCAAEWKDDE